MYSKAMPIADLKEELSLLTYLYCASCLRHTQLLFSIWSAKGWGPLAFTAMLHPGPYPYLAPVLSRSAGGIGEVTNRLYAITGIPSSDIAGILSQLHGPWLMHLTFRDRLDILQTAAGVFSSLNYKRKESSWHPNHL